jgi:hypothetical protein
MRLGLIFSNDWELFGDGSGDYFEIQHNPLKNLLKVVEDHGAKLTVMAEVGQQWAHQRIAERAEWARNVVEAWEALLRETIKNKHDVQLHLHPQWIDAEYKDNKWHVNLDNWAISSLSPEVMADTLKKGKLYLENTLKQVDHSYECIAFRAGAYCIEPSKVVIQNLLKAGIVCDTSVTKGKQNPAFFDYRDAHSNCVPWFTTTSSVKHCSNEKNGLLEIPIYSFEMIDLPILRKIISQFPYHIISLFNEDSETKKWFKEKNKSTKEIYPKYKRPYHVNPYYNKSTKAKLIHEKFFSKKFIQLNYDNISSNSFIKGLYKVYNSKELENMKDRDIIIPVMSTGHVKAVHNFENIKRILDKINSTLKERVVYWTLRDAVRYWLTEVEACRVIYGRGRICTDRSSEHGASLIEGIAGLHNNLSQV